MFALVTGSTGFLGSHLVERLVARGHQVRAVVRNPDRAGVLKGTNVEIVCGDVKSPKTLVSAARGVDVVFHSAALVTNWAPWSEFLAGTVQGTENLLEVAACAGVKRFIHVSSARVYDDRYCRKHGVVTEDAPRGSKGFRHFGYYARAKVMAEAAVWRYQARLPVSVIRPTWIYGPRDQTIIPALIGFLRESSARWPSGNDPCADPIFVTDVADCAIAAAIHPRAVGQAYNASPNSVIRVREFLGALCQALGFRAPDRSVPYAMAAFAARTSELLFHIARSDNAPRWSRAGLAILTQDIRHEAAKAHRELDWRSKVELSTGVGLTAAWIAERYPELTGPLSRARR